MKERIEYAGQLLVRYVNAEHRQDMLALFFLPGTMRNIPVRIIFGSDLRYSRIMECFVQIFGKPSIMLREGYFYRSMEEGMPASQTLRLLVTDINHHVRDFIKRELERDGHTVACASNGSEICHALTNAFPPDVIVIDPEVLSIFGQALIEEIQQKGPAIHIIFHGYDEDIGEIETDEKIHVVEKSADSIGKLKEMIRQCSQLKP